LFTLHSLIFGSSSYPQRATGIVPPDRPEDLRPGLVAVMKGLPALGITSMNIASASIQDELAKPGEPQKPIRGLTFKRLQGIYHDYGDVLPRAAVQISYPVRGCSRPTRTRRAMAMTG
jgi:hypothetical protein